MRAIKLKVFHSMRFARFDCGFAAWRALLRSDPLPGFGVWVMAFVIGAILHCGCTKPNLPPRRVSSTPTYYVATNGNDEWSGSLATANRRKTDGPFASVPRALQVARAARQNQATAIRPITISLRGGTYFLGAPLVLKPEDSNLSLVAYANEKPILSGGSPIRDWREMVINGKRAWAAEIPEVRAGKWFFHELWINGSRGIRARHPNKGYLHIASLPDSTPEWNQGQTRFSFREGDIKAWPSLTNAEAIAMTRWVESRLPILSVDTTNRIVSFGRKSVFQLAADDPYYLEHAYEFLDEPGEWYLDQTSGTLYYLPRPGEAPGSIEAIAPALPKIVQLEGNPQATNFVENVRFRGITFSHAEWYFPEDFKGGKGRPNNKPAPAILPGGFMQAAVGVPGAVWGQGMRACDFEKCSFSKLGMYGLEMVQGCSSNRISRCDFSDLGAGGLKIDGPISTNMNEATRANEISDCDIHDGGKLFASAVGIWIGQSSDNRITHNLIHDFFYTGISIGWTWGYGPTLATNNLVAFNHVHHIGVKSDGDGPILSDMGGIYTLGRQPGTKVLNNLWHDIGAIHYGGWGIYFDEGSSGILAMSNVVYRTTHGGFHQHYGATNVVRNNIFAFGRDAQIQRTRPESHSSFTFETNVVYFDSGALLTGDWSGDKYEMDRNTYFDARPNAKPASINFAGSSFDQWRQRGHDTNSLIADPLCFSPKENDLRLRPESPAFSRGFQPINIDTIGPRRR